MCIKFNASAEQSDLNHQGGHYANQGFKLNEISPILNFPHVEFPSASRRDAEMELILPRQLRVFRVVIIAFNYMVSVTELSDISPALNL